MSIYSDFLEEVKEIYDLRRIGSLLGWDQETYMPRGSIEGRANARATLSSILHRRRTSEKMKRMLTALNERPSDLLPHQRANLRVMTREYGRAVNIPSEVVKEEARLTARSFEAWQRARNKNDFSIFHPWLEKVVELKRKIAEHIGYENVPYDALLDEFEPHVTTKDIDPTLNSLVKKLVPIVKKITDSGVEIDNSFLHQNYGVKEQKTFGRGVIEDMGFDLNCGRLDVSAHPFTSGTGDDVRLTTRYREDHLTSSLFAMIHEAGHGLYEQGYRKEHYRTPMASHISLGYHESQSRLWENIVGRSRMFWEHYYPQLQHAFSQQLRQVSLDDFYNGINRVRPSFIRVEADEVTYNLHVLLRYELEKKMLSGDIGTAELPRAWNEKMEQYVGVVPKNDSLGVLQDIHWSSGYIGYFPTYTLGNIYASQMYRQIQKDVPSLEEDIGHGRFEPLLSWLRENVHEHGNLYTAKELTQELFGEPLSDRYFIDHIKEKFGRIYDISF